MTRPTMRISWCIAVTCCLWSAAFAFDPLNGDYTKDNPLDIRIISYNHGRNFISVPSRDAAFNRILTALYPDIICFQECEVGISDGQIAGRLDSILPVSGGSWQIHSGMSDGYIRTVIASRFSLSMTRTDTIPASSTRGVTLALADLPDADYSVDVYLLGVHLKCCGDPGGSEDAQRQDSADAIANWLGDARGVSRPSGDNVVLPADTPMINLGDFNLVGGPQPEDTLITGDIQDESTYGPDVKGDWDDSNMTDQTPTDPFTGDTFTWQGSGSYPPSRLDRFFHTDSVVTVANSFLLNTDTMTPAALAAAGLQATDTLPDYSSDHLPLALDVGFGPECAVNGDCDDDNVCTQDICNASGVCEYVNSSGACDDGLFCTLTDVCVDGACVGSGDPCPPSEYCNEQTDTCDLAPPQDVEIIGSWTSGLNHTEESGSDRALLFFAFAEDNDADMDVTSVLYGGQSMTKVIERNEGTGYRSYAVAYVLDETGIEAATSDAFVATWAEQPSRDPEFASVFLQNVDQTDLTGAEDSNGNTSSPIQTGALPTNDGDMAIVAGSCGSDGTYTVDNGFTLGIEVSPESADGVAGYKSATGVDETPKLSHTSVNRQVILGFVVQAGGWECVDNEDCDDVNPCTTDTCPDHTCQYSFAPDTTECRTAAGDCDVAENCTGSSADCPSDNVRPDTYECRASAGDCDVAEICDGMGVDCPTDVFLPDTTECRAAAGDCDVAEDCTGSSADCPSDNVKPDTYECRASAGDCDVAENCDGMGVDCPTDVFLPDTTECRAAAGDCDVAENCTGSAADCPTDGFEPLGTPCPDGLFCNGDEECDGLGACQDASYACAASQWCDEDADECVAYGDGDFEPDSDVDLADFAAFQVCFGQPGTGNCAAGNITGLDAMIDLSDCAEFVDVMNGPQ